MQEPFSPGREDEALEAGAEEEVEEVPQHTTLQALESQARELQVCLHAYT
jgi:hypothetical protein